MNFSYLKRHFSVANFGTKVRSETSSEISSSCSCQVHDFKWIKICLGDLTWIKISLGISVCKRDKGHST